jgi:hypothetical protein
VLRKITELKHETGLNGKCRILDDEELWDLHGFPSIVRALKSGRLQGPQHTAKMEEAMRPLGKHLEHQERFRRITLRWILGRRVMIVKIMGGRCNFLRIVSSGRLCLVWAWDLWKTPERQRKTWEYNIKIDLRELGHDDGR